MRISSATARAWSAAPIALGRYGGVYKATGVKVNAQFVHVFRFKNGKVASFQQYTDTAQFKDAVSRRAGA